MQPTSRGGRPWDGPLLRLLIAVSLLLLARSALAEFTRDRAANEKIDEALNQHYLSSNFAKAEELLTGTVRACEDKCRPSTIARAWMYVGILRGSGKQDQNGARDAFRLALDADPAVVLDSELSTPPTKATFEAVRSERRRPGEAAPAPDASATGPAPAPSAPEPAPPVAPSPAPAPAPDAEVLNCSPAATKVESRRPIPISCGGDGEATSMNLRYLAFGTKTWATLPMRHVQGYFQAEIPCTATENAGPLRYFVVAADATGMASDTFGSKAAPITIEIVAELKAPPPSFPGQPPPARCHGKELCPPDFPGCGGDPSKAQRGTKDWGASCRHSAECMAGLLCVGGACDTAPTCSVDTDCDSGFCHDGRCDVRFGERAGPADYPRHFVGLHFAADFGFMGGKNVCSSSSDTHECYLAGEDEAYPGPLPIRSEELGDPYPGTGVGNGFALGTLRILGSYDYAVLPAVTLGGRLGFAFRGGPSPEGEAGFFPVHAEARAGYFFLGLKEQPFRPYVQLGGGVAQVDLKTEVVVQDCSEIANYDSFTDCILARGAYDSSNNLVDDLPEVELDAYRRLGRMFVSAGAGAIVAVAPGLGAQVQLSALLMFPDSGLVLEPSVGGVYAF